MGSIQISSMSWERSWKPGRFSFFPKGALTHHPEGAVVSRPLAGHVRSAEGYPLLQAAPAMQPFTSSPSLSAYR